MPGSATALRISAALADKENPKTREAAIMEVLAAFRTTKGNAVHAADELGVSHRALTRWMRTHKDLAQRLKKKHPNRNSVQRLKFRGKTRTIADWADELGVSRQTIYHRLDAGWPVARALSEEA